jgi:hypothetical protein
MATRSSFLPLLVSGGAPNTNLTNSPLQSEIISYRDIIAIAPVLNDITGGIPGRTSFMKNVALLIGDNAFLTAGEITTYNSNITALATYVAANNKSLYGDLAIVTIALLTASLTATLYNGPSVNGNLYSPPIIANTTLNGMTQIMNFMVPAANVPGLVVNMSGAGNVLMGYHYLSAAV